MIYIAIIYVFAVVLYNFQPENANEVIVNIFGNDIPIWRFHINFFRNFVTACAMFELARLSVQKGKKYIYIGAGLVAALCTLFHCCLLIGASGIEEWIYNMNNSLWSIISGMFGIIVLFALKFYYLDGTR